MVLHPVDLRAIRDCAQGASAQPRGALPYSDSFGATRATGTSIVVDGDGAAGPGVYGESGGSMRDYLSRELTVAVPADSGRFTGSEGPGDLVHALVYVPRDAAAWATGQSETGAVYELVLDTGGYQVAKRVR